MTDRFNGCTVVFDREIREDDAEHLLNAIRMIKGVAQVIPAVSEGSDFMAAQRERMRIREELYDFIQDKFK